MPRLLLSVPALALALDGVGTVVACPPDQIEAATALVLRVNPVIVQERQALAEQSRQRDWQARLTLRYASEGADESMRTEPSAGLQVEIPLFDRARALEVQKARLALQRQRDGVLAEFLGRMETLCATSAEVSELDNSRQFYRDRLQYRQEQVREGLQAADSLWQETEEAQQAEHAFRRKRGELSAMQQTVARRFGGGQWKRLQALLVAASH